MSQNEPQRRVSFALDNKSMALGMVLARFPHWGNIVAVAVLARLVLLPMSGFGWYMGFNEAVYFEIAQAYESGQVVPLRDGAPFFDTGPLSTWLMAASMHVLGATETAARIPSVLALALGGLAAGALVDRDRRSVRVALIMLCPAVFLWFGRAQTDAWMVAGVLTYMAGLRHVASRTGGAAVAAGLAIALLAKQPAGLALVALGWVPQQHRLRAFAWSGLGLGIAAAWWILMAIRFPAAMVDSLSFHATERAVPFLYAPVVLLAVILAALPLVAPAVTSLGRLSSRRWRHNSLRIAAVAAAFGAFALFTAPPGHEYYAMPASALLAALPWKFTHASAALAVAASVVMSAGAVWYAGDLGDDRVQETAVLLADFPGEDVASWPQLVPQLRHYSGIPVAYLPEDPTTVDGLVVTPADMPCPALQAFPGPNISWTVYDCRRGRGT